MWIAWIKLGNDHNLKPVAQSLTDFVEGAGVGTTYGFDTKLGDRRWRHQLGSFRHGRSNHPREGPPHPLIPLGWRWTTLLLLFLQSLNARGMEDIDCDFSGSLAATCKYECEQTGGCTAKYSGPPRSGNTIVSFLFFSVIHNMWCKKTQFLLPGLVLLCLLWWGLQWDSPRVRRLQGCDPVREELQRQRRWSSGVQAGWWLPIRVCWLQPAALCELQMPNRFVWKGR